MNILLFGEYSGFYNTLKQGLLKHNHNVLHVGIPDGFKNYPLDISFNPKVSNTKIIHLIRKVIYKFFKYDIAGIEIFIRFLIHRNKLKNFDVVQLINPFPIQTHPYLEKQVLKFLFRNNKSVYLSACGDDYQYVNFIINSKIKYHVLTPYLKDNSLKKYFLHTLEYQKQKHKKLHHFVIENIKKIIPTDLDYEMTYRSIKKTDQLIPYPINLNRLKYNFKSPTDKIIIFHGVNPINYYKKGNDLFDKALDIIKNKFPDKINIERVERLPYKEYIEKIDNCHILLDQVYSYDQGYNALEAMAKGKVVFTGAEKIWLDHYQLEEDTIAINSTPDVNEIVEKLDWLISNPEYIERISKNARMFIEKEHDYLNITTRYIEAWKK